MRIQSMLNFAGRLATAPARQTPDVFILGAQKAGTSSLFDWLAASPDFAPPLRKEVHYLTRDRAWKWGTLPYRMYFPIRRRGQVTGEASVNLLLFPQCPARASKVNPDAKLIVSLRNPADRAWSHYWMVRREGHETLPFRETLERRHGHTYLSRGRYAEQLERWFSVFPKDRFLLLRSEDALATPQATAERMHHWLGLRPGMVEHQRLNEGSYPAMPDDVRRWLDDYYAPHNERLAELIGWAW